MKKPAAKKPAAKRPAAKKASSEKASPESPIPPPQIDPESHALADRLAVGVRDRVETPDPQGHKVHDRIALTLTAGDLAVRAQTGWNTGWTVESTPADSGLTVGDALVVDDWIIDNHGPMGVVMRFGDVVFGRHYMEPKVEDAATQSRAQAFARALCAAFGAPSLRALAEATWALAGGNRSALWRMHNLADCTEDLGRYRDWGS